MTMVSTRNDGHVRVIVLNRPDVRNALGIE